MTDERELTKAQSDELLLQDLLKKLNRSPHEIRASQGKGKVALNASLPKGKLNWLESIRPHRPVTTTYQRPDLTRIRMFESELGWYARKHIDFNKPYPTTFERTEADKRIGRM